VQERFIDRVAFEAHCRRAATSTCGQTTVGIRRNYTIT